MQASTLIPHRHRPSGSRRVVQKERFSLGDEPPIALGGIGALGCAKTIPPCHRVQTDTGTYRRIGVAGTDQVRNCQAKKGVVEWVTRGFDPENDSTDLPGALIHLPCSTSANSSPPMLGGNGGSESNVMIDMTNVGRTPQQFVAFDLLWHDGRDLRNPQDGELLEPGPHHHIVVSGQHPTASPRYYAVFSKLKIK
jgi:hypothetical protein